MTTADRPYVLVKFAMSLDGCLDDASPTRLLLSNEADFDRVDEQRSRCDAVLVGAETVRKDNPRLVIRSPDRRQRRIELGQPGDFIKVTVTRSGNLDPQSSFFTVGGGEKWVYCASSTQPAFSSTLGSQATVIRAAGPDVDLPWLLDDLFERGVRTLMVEGGSQIISQFLSKDLVNELQMSVAPILVGDAAAPRFVQPGFSPPNAPLVLQGVTRLGDVVELRYQPNRESPGDGHRHPRT